MITHIDPMTESYPDSYDEPHLNPLNQVIIYPGELEAYVMNQAEFGPPVSNEAKLRGFAFKLLRIRNGFATTQELADKAKVNVLWLTLLEEGLISLRDPRIDSTGSNLDTIAIIRISSVAKAKINWFDVAGRVEVT